MAPRSNVEKRQRFQQNNGASTYHGIAKSPHKAEPRRSKHLLERAAGTALKSPLLPQEEIQTRKRTCEVLDDQTTTILPAKRQQLYSLQHYNDRPSHTHSIDHWCKVGQWPRSLFEMESKMLALKRTSSLGRKRSIDGASVSTGITDDMTREEKSAPYIDSQYEQQLKIRGFYMEDHDLGPNEASRAMIKSLLEREPSLPENSRFTDQLFEKTFKNINNRNERRIMRDIGELIVPSPDDLVSRGELEIQHLIESMDEGWNLAQPITGTRPQPDFCVGFERTAFTEAQLDKIRPILGDSRSQTSLFRTTWEGYFNILSSESKRSGQLDVADRQNAHAMFISVRAIVNLYRLVGRHKELNRKILAFSVSYDDRTVRAYGYYPVVTDDSENYYRHPILELLLQAKGGRDRWICYKFVKSIYQLWAGQHLADIRKVLDEVPPVGFTHTTATTPSQSTGLSQQVASSSISGENVSSESIALDTQNLASSETERTPKTPVAATSRGSVKGSKKGSMLSRESSKQ